MFRVEFVKYKFNFFTFQSGSIQMLCVAYWKKRRMALHSNLVLFKSLQPECLLAEVLTLHSNLVLFKLGLKNKLFTSLFLYIPIWFYSNNCRQPLCLQSLCLYIPIWLYSNIYLANPWNILLFFTFQSGYIQIDLALLRKPPQSALYIPIWLYSNASLNKYRTNFCNLYIPIWLYSNDFGVAVWYSCDSFTFQSGYIQINITF